MDDPKFQQLARVRKLRIRSEIQGLHTCHSEQPFHRWQYSTVNRYSGRSDRGADQQDLPRTGHCACPLDLAIFRDARC